ncbi:oxidoreductase [Amycolatopsis pithecellobii]|uniref:SDR family NAD(P)-dependent oxidoreductase n=1 Tax=Amycolatopsis pithecellobii TaxID=664692 RepID=A0A6N7Z255_9PSEU|nr:oxidoreductase [Amycolatopsis pithecellobii]MTD54051.1 SDR family NAD(P)-dependent oxidoreductase [Amycolatopsis pithecellobii]
MRIRRPQWTEADIGDQTGRTAVITGANSGIGYAVSRMLARHGATVVLACRDGSKAAEAAARLHTYAPQSSIHTVSLDLASTRSIRTAATRLKAEYPRIDLLIHNAGCMRLQHELTEDGFERTLATNCLGPFLLTHLMLDHISNVPGSRVVTVTSSAHRFVTIDFDDLHGHNGYHPLRAYARSKLAILLTAYQLQRRLWAAGAPTLAVAAHPGNCRTAFGDELHPLIRGIASPRLGWLGLFQAADLGALAVLRAALDPTACGGDYYGPAGLMQFIGHPERLRSSAASYDLHAQHRLWEEAERLTGARYPRIKA